MYMIASHVGESGKYGYFGKYGDVKSPNVCKSVPYMVAGHVGEYGEYGDFGKYGDFGEFLSNRQMYVNHFHTWWSAILVNLANTAISANMVNACQIAKCM